MPPLFHAILAYSLLTALLAHHAHAHAAPTFRPVSTATATTTTTTTAATTTHADHHLALPVVFTLIDGTRITGTLTAWDENTFTGTFGRREWTELTYRDTWRILHRLIDRDIPDDWLLLARAMLLTALDQPDAEKWSERAIRHARRVAGENELDAIETRIDEIRAEAEAEAKKQAPSTRDHDLEPEKLRTRTPEADDWPSAPWPELSRNEQRNAVLTKKNDAQQALAAIDRDDALDPIETATALLYTDLDRQQAVGYAMQLDAIHRQLARLLHTNPNRNPFWGKLVLIILSDRDQYDRLQTDAFGFISDAPVRPVPGMVHPIGPKVFITLHHPGRAAERDFELELVRLVVRALLHRHISPRRLPPWAGDGLGMVIADRLLYQDSPVVKQHRRSALEFIRASRSIEPLRGQLEVNYADDHWSQRELPIASLGGLLIELMAREKPRDLAQWVEAVKRGAGWREALEKVYHVKLGTLIDTAMRYYRVND